MTNTHTDNELTAQFFQRGETESIPSKIRNTTRKALLKTDVWTGVEEKQNRVRQLERVAYALTCVNREPTGTRCVTQELKQGLCNNQRGGSGREVGGRLKTEGTYAHLWLSQAGYD